MALNVLIVDDSEVMRSVIHRILTMSGFDLGTVLKAENGEQALKLLDSNWIDVVLTDINMPVMNGEELLERIKSIDTLADIPVIIVSTEERCDKIDAILAKGAVGYITKPFKPEDIRTIISNSLGVEPDGNFIEGPEDSDF